MNRIAEGRAGPSSEGHTSKVPADEFKPPVPSHRRGSEFALRNPQELHENVYHDVPSIKSIGKQRSASIPDLTMDLAKHTIIEDERSLRKRLSNPTCYGSPLVQPRRAESNQLHSQSMKDSPTHQILKPDLPLHSQSVKANKVNETPNILSGGSVYDSPPTNILSEGDYQQPRPTTDVIYNIPIPANDPRNDYGIPRPMEETYMVPRPARPAQNLSVNNGLVKPPMGSSPLLERKSAIPEHSYEDPDNYGGTKHSYEDPDNYGGTSHH